jgi:hypothetical protein
MDKRELCCNRSMPARRRRERQQICELAIRELELHQVIRDIDHLLPFLPPCVQAELAQKAWGKTSELLVAARQQPCSWEREAQINELLRQALAILDQINHLL